MLNEFANVLRGKSDVYSLSITVQTTLSHISICFLPQYQRQRNCSFSERELKKELRDTLSEQRGMDSYQISQSDCEIFCNCGKKGRNPSLLLWWLCLIFAWWNCLLSWKFTQKVTSLLWVSRKRLQVFQNLMTAQQVFGVWNTCNVLSPLNQRGSDMGIGNLDAFLFIKFQWRYTITKIRLDREGELAYSLTFDFPKSSSS